MKRNLIFVLLFAIMGLGGGVLFSSCEGDEECTETNKKLYIQKATPGTEPYTEVSKSDDC